MGDSLDPKPLSVSEQALKAQVDLRQSARNLADNLLVIEQYLFGKKPPSPCNDEGEDKDFDGYFNKTRFFHESTADELSKAHEILKKPTVGCGITHLMVV